MRTLARWVMTRRTDAIALSALCVALMQLALVLLLSIGVHGQSQEVINDRLAIRQQSIDMRVTSIEQLNLPVRLAVLERAADEVAEVRKLIYAVIATLFGSLFAQIVQIRGQRRLRRDGDE